MFPFLPESRVARSTRYEKPGKLPFVTVVDGVMRLVGRGDEELGVENIFVAVSNIIDSHRVHVMDVEARMDLVTLDAKITALITVDNPVSGPFPLPRGVEHLVEMTLKAESSVTNNTSQSEIPVAPEEVIKLS